MTRILGLETSCDETAAAVVADGRWVRSHIVASQHELHEQYGGVVPEIASRAHLERLTPVVRQALDEAGGGAIDAVAVGNRPGLVGALIVGVSAAQALAWSLDRPLVGVDHVRAHLYAPFLVDDASVTPPPLEDAFPSLGLVVSGGHTSLYLLDSPTEMRLLGRTIDDAVGEACDKAAVILEAGYPGGPKLEALAARGDAAAYKLPRSLLGPQSLDFSFSGLKTALLYQVRGKPERPASPRQPPVFERAAADLSDQARADLAAAFQQAVVDVLMTKLERAVGQVEAPLRSVILGGGVTANALLRRRAGDLAQRHGLALHLPAMSYCVDNAAMIAGLAAHEQPAATLELPAQPRA